jgi:transposase
MMIIGVDYHPSFQQIAFMDQATGEYGERRLNRSDGEAEKLYRESKQPGVSVRVGIEVTRSHAGSSARWWD